MKVVIVFIRKLSRPRLKNFQVVETETGRDSEKFKLSRPRLFETGFFQGCRYRDQSRLENLMVVETETDRDWAKVVETETLTRLSLFSESGVGRVHSKVISAKLYSKAIR